VYRNKLFSGQKTSQKDKTIGQQKQEIEHLRRELEKALQKK